MTVTRHRILPFPFKPVRSFTAVACGLERITLKDEYAALAPDLAMEIATEAGRLSDAAKMREPGKC